MSLVTIDGSLMVPIGPGWNAIQTVPSNVSTVTLDAANEACIMIGHIITSDGASHTIDTTGSSSLGWRTGAVTFANAGTTVKVGLAALDTATGPPGRAVNVADVITFDVSKSMTGGGGGVTANAWQSHVPDAGSKTIANGDLVAFCIQMTARGGADSILNNLCQAEVTLLRPTITGFFGGAYGAQLAIPNAVITFSDGALGYFHGSEVFSATSTRTYNSGSATKEYGQLYKLPWPVKVCGLFGWVDPDNDFDFVLYSDPLGGSPVAEKTVSVDASTVAVATGRRFMVTFAAPYQARAQQPLGVVLKPGASNISTYYRTLASATHRIADPWGTSGYGISRASGAFADANSSLDHYYVGLLVSAFEHGVHPQYLMGM